MSRAVWFVAGAATGVYGLLRAKRAARILTPDGIAARAAAVAAGVRVLTAEVATGMTQRESQLREQLAGAPAAPGPEPARLEHSGPSDGPEASRRGEAEPPDRTGLDRTEGPASGNR